MVYTIELIPLWEHISCQPLLYKSEIISTAWTMALLTPYKILCELPTSVILYVRNYGQIQWIMTGVPKPFKPVRQLSNSDSMFLKIHRKLYLNKNLSSHIHFLQSLRKTESQSSPLVLASSIVDSKSRAWPWEICAHVCHLLDAYSGEWLLWVRCIIHYTGDLQELCIA